MTLRSKKTVSLLCASLATFLLSSCSLFGGDDSGTSGKSQAGSEASAPSDYVSLNRQNENAAPATGNGGRDGEEATIGRDEPNMPTREAPVGDTGSELANTFADEADAAYAAGDITRALKYVDFALENDPGNLRAKKLKANIYTELQLSGSTFNDLADDVTARRNEANYEIQRRLVEARRLFEAESFTESIERAESAIDVIRWSGSRDDQAALAEAREIVRKAADRREEQRITEAARIKENQRREQEILALSRLETYRSEIRNLYQEARTLFDRREYSASSEKLAQILRKDPFNPDVTELKNISDALGMGQRRRNAEERFGVAWRQAVAEIDAANVFPASGIEFADVEYWDRVNRRRDRILSEQRSPISKIDLAVYNAIDSKMIDVDFEKELELTEVVREIRAQTNINIILASDVASNTLQQELALGKMQLRRALNIITKQAGDGVAWRVENGALQIAADSNEVKSGSKTDRVYNVADILINLTDFRGQEPRLQSESDRFPEDDNAEDIALPVDRETLIELITEMVEPDAWADREPEIRQNQLVVFNTPEVLDRVQQLLEDLRKSQGVVVNIETRFITIRDNFLQDIGIDFRGVGGSPEGANPPPVAAALDDVNFGTANVPDGAGTSNDAGFFFQDINNNNTVNQDIRGRVENLFDSAVGGRRGGSGLTNFGGAAFQLSFVDNPEVTAVLRAVQKKERATLLTSPSVSVHNTQRGHVSVLSEVSYISDFEVNVAANSAIADPIIDIIRDGIVLDVRPTVSADRRYVTLELRPTLAVLTRPIGTITTSLGNGPPVSIQTPELALQRLRSTITVPDGGSFLLGGLRRLLEEESESGVPIFSDIPLIGWLFTRKARTTTREDVIIIVTVAVIDLEATVADTGRG